MDYFQPLDKHAKLGVDWSEVVEDVKICVTLGLWVSLLIFPCIWLLINHYPHIQQSLDYVGYGTIRPCQLDCGHCGQEWHHHYQKAWRKVK